MSQRRAIVLLVEDNPADVELVRASLARSNIELDLHSARTGEEALSFLRGPGLRPDLILLDLNLPKMNGHQVLAEVRAGEDTSRIPVVMLSSSLSGDDVRQALDSGANAYVSKPVKPDELVSKIISTGHFWLVVAVKES